MRRIAALYGPRVGPAELRLPIWKLVDVLAVRTLAPEDPG